MAKNYKSSVHALTTSFAQVKAADPNRSLLILTNQDAANAIQVAFGLDTAYITVAPGATLVLHEAPGNLIRAKGAAGTPNLTVIVA